MKDLSLSIIIPTYNRKDILKKCLRSLFNQTYPHSDLEIIVIDDNSTDGTEKLVKSLTHNSSCALRYFKQEHKGPAAAKNVGIKNAKGNLLFFIGDDAIATPTLIEEHLKWHERYPEENVAILGYVTWSPEIKITPFMKWLEKGGPQFHFWQIEDKVNVDGKYFYTSNISLKRKFLLENDNFFDEEFSYAAFEDVELGYRLKTKGIVLKYNKDAISYHYHYTSLNDACRRMIKVGESSQILAEKIGEEQRFFSKSIFRKISGNIKFIIYFFIAKFYEKKAIKGDIFGYVMKYYWQIGVKRFRNKRK